MTASAEMIEAVGIPSTSQLFVRRGSSRNRVVPYQTKKSRTMSPGRSERARRASISRTIAPTRPEIDSYRKSGTKCASTGVVPPSTGQAQTWVRFAHWIAIPQGRFVGGP